jgi:hypothetical protein
LGVSEVSKQCNHRNLTLLLILVLSAGSAGQLHFPSSTAHVGLTRELCCSSLRRLSFLNLRSLPARSFFRRFHSFTRSLTISLPLVTPADRSHTSSNLDENAGLKFMRRSWTEEMSTFPQNQYGGNHPIDLTVETSLIRYIVGM